MLFCFIVTILPLVMFAVWNIWERPQTLVPNQVYNPIRVLSSQALTEDVSQTKIRIRFEIWNGDIKSMVIPHLGFPIHEGQILCAKLILTNNFSEDAYDVLPAGNCGSLLDQKSN